MKPFLLPCGDSLLLVPIPEDAEDIRFSGSRTIKYFSGNEGIFEYTPTDRNIFSNAEILGKFNSSDKQVDFAIKEKWVDCLYNTNGYIAYKDYENDNNIKPSHYESCLSLLSHLSSSNKIESKMVLVILISK